MRAERGRAKLRAQLNRGSSESVSKGPQRAISDPEGVEAPEDETATSEAYTSSVTITETAGGHIPEAVQRKLVKVGMVATDRLLSILEGPGWDKLRPSDQRGFLGLAFTRAHGAPASRQVEHTGSIDLVSQSLGGLASKLPENVVELDKLRGNDVEYYEAEAEDQSDTQNES